MLHLLASCALGAVLALAAVLKLASPRSSRAALATFGLRRPGMASAALGLIVVVELALAVAVVAGSSLAAYLASGLLTSFALALVVALGRGRKGAPCACFGSRSRVGPPAVARNLALATAFAALPLLPRDELSTDGWLTLGLAVAGLAIVGLTVAVLALAREVGMLRIQLGPQPALDIPGEGPPVGTRTDVLERFSPAPGAEHALAVFSSDGCALCATLEPAVAAIGRDPLVALEVFDEVRDSDVWRELSVPGSPYAVALDLDGTVRAKGTFNSFGQLEGILAAAERRQAETARA